MRPYVLIVASLALMLSATQAVAKKDKGIPPGHAKAGKFMGAPSQTVPVGWSSTRFSTSDGTLIRNFYAAHPATWNALPPGIAMNYARGKPLPPGIAKKVLPAALASQLPYRAGYEYSQVGRDIVLIETATRLVVDIIENVFD